MAAKRFYLSFRPAFDLNGVAIPDAKLYFFNTGSLTPAPVYSDEALTNQLPNPVVADAAGRWPAIYLDDTIVYRVQVRDGDDVVIPGHDEDPYLASVVDSLTSDLQDIVDATSANLVETEAAVELAKQYANKTPGSPVEGTDYSALHWLTVASQYAMADTDTDIPYAAPGDRGAKYWAEQANTVVQALISNTGTYFLTPADGVDPVTGVPDGQTFNVSQNGNLYLYRNNGGVAELLVEFTTSTFTQEGTGAVIRAVQDKLRDFVNPRDFGAVGDDVTDDTAAFVAAAATGKPVVITAGIYRVAGVAFSARVFFQGGKIRRTGGSLAFSGGIDAAPGDNIFLDAVYPNVDVNNTLTPAGWVDWFGYDADAIETCHKVFRLNFLGPRDYFLTRTLILNQSYREVIGSRGSAEGAGGTRLVMIGSAAADQPLVQVGTLNTTAVLSCARRLNIRYINTIRAGDTYQPVSTDRREDAVPGWKIAGWYEGHMEDCFDYGSATHYRIYGTIGCTLIRCGGVRPGAGASNGHPDYYTAFVVGGYSTSFGFIGANASLTIESCGTAGGTGTDRMGLLLFGYIGDTWVKKFEDSQLEYGIFVDGADASGTPITTLSAHQDVRILECVLDAHVFNCLTVQNINAGGAVEIGGSTYCAQNAAGDAVLINNCKGLVSLESLDIIANSGLANYGVRIAGSKRVTVSEAVHIKDARVGLKAESSSSLSLRPTITRANAGGTSAVEISGVARSYVQPIIDSESAVFDYGISSDSSTNYCEFNVTGINYGCFTTVSAGRKIWHNGSTWGGGGTFGSSNIATGVLG